MEIQKVSFAGCRVFVPVEGEGQDKKGSLAKKPGKSKTSQKGSLEHTKRKDQKLLRAQTAVLSTTKATE